jgi:hypothetical protein
MPNQQWAIIEQRSYSMSKPPQPNHVAGNSKGEEMALKRREPGRDPNHKQYRGARDSTGINPSDRQPILSVMPSIPPA